MPLHTLQNKTKPLWPVAALLLLGGCADLTRVHEFRSVELVKPAAARAAGAVPGLPRGVQINRGPAGKRPTGAKAPPRGAARPKRGG
ncbi:MAG: hypothetical protein VB934_22895 [Polyangiaceae bacterium]